MKRPVVMAEFASGSALLDGLRALEAGGVSRLDVFTPYEVDGLQALLPLRPSRLPWIVLGAGLAVGGGAYLLQRWAHVIAASRASGPAVAASVPLSLQVAALIAVASAVIAALVIGGLPRLWDPVFEVAGFERATHDRFWLAVAAGDPALDHDRDTVALEAAGALRVVWLAGDDRRA